MNKTVLVFGTKFDLIKRIKAFGLKVVLVDEQEDLNADVNIVVDGPKAAIGQFDVEQFSKYQGQIQGLIVCLEDYVELAAAVRDKYFNHLLGLSRDQARIVRDKLELKKFLFKNDIPVARFSELCDFEQLSEKLSLPFLVKPRLGFLAQGIEIIGTREEYDKWKLNHQNDSTIYFAEEYIKAPIEYCCDTIVAGSKVIAQFPGEYTVSCLESNKTHGGFGVNFPGFLPEDQVDKIKTYTRKFIEKLGVADGFFHTEFLWDGKNWFFGESGCRLPGGLQIPAESFISGINILDLYIKMFVTHLRDKDIMPLISYEKPYVGYYLYPKKVGHVGKIINHIQNDPTILDSKVLINEGDVVAYEDSSVSMVATIIYEAKSRDDLMEWSIKVPDLFKVEYKE